MAGTTARSASAPSLAEEFGGVDEARWRSVVERALRDAPFDRLRSRTRDGIVVEPIYAAADADGPVAGRAPATPWTIVQRIDNPDTEAANTQALDDLENGANGLALVLAGSGAGRGAGLACDAETIASALAGVRPELIELDLDAGARGFEAAGALAEAVMPASSAATGLRVCFGLDPIGAMARAGGLPLAEDAMASRLAGMVADLDGKGFSGPFIRLDGRPFNEAGASDGQELAAVLATLVHYLRWLEAADADLDRAPGWFSATLVADTDQFATIAKLRAVRLLWSRVLETSGLPFRPLRLAAETSWRMLTRRDPHANMVRATIACFAAGVGGADAVTVLPHSAALGLPDAFARRVARNTQLVLIEESGLARVADPVAGAGYPEYLTRSLAETAWRLFQEIEREGGIVESLKAGTLQTRIAATRQERDADIATRAEAIVGTSEFPLAAEHRADVAAMPEPQTTAAPDFSVVCDPLPSRRTAEPYERLRDAADAFAAANGAPPSVLVATLGRQAEFARRLTWISNLLAAGGMVARPSGPLADADAVRSAIASSDAPVVCLCGTDAAYEALMPQIGAIGRPLAVAGPKPADTGGIAVDVHLFAGMDVLDALGRLHRLAGVDTA